MKHLLALLAVTAACQVSAQQYTYVGAGAQTCAQYSEVARMSPNLRSGLQFGYLSWVQGHLSGMNLQRGMNSSKDDMLLLPDDVTITATLAKFCADNPMENVNMASFYIWTQLLRQQSRK